MVVGVKVLIHGRALDAEIGAQVNDLAAELEQRHGEFGGDTVRQGQEHDLRLFGQQFGFGFAEAERLGARMMGEFRKDLRQRLPGVLARGDGGQLGVRMRQQQPDQFLAGVTRRAHDGDFFFHIRLFKYSTLNLNKPLNRSITSKVKHLHVRCPTHQKKTPPD